MEQQPSNLGVPTGLPFTIFFNQRGLRAGWRLLIFAALFSIMFFLAGTMVRLVVQRLAPSLPTLLMMNETLLFLAVLVTTWIMSRIEQRNMGEYGLPLKNTATLSLFLRGFVFWGFLPLSLLLLVLRAMHVFYFGNITLHGAQVIYWGAIWLLLFILVGLFEEYSSRGYLLYTLADGIGFWPAAIVMAVLFALLHSLNPGETRIGILMAAFFALFASLLLRLTGNLWMAVGAHAGWDWAESYFYGVNDSGAQLPGHLLKPHVQGPEWLNGGSTGPEGSALCLILMLVMSVLFFALHRKDGQQALLITTAPEETPRRIY
jgi:uncharacterized protein